MKLLNFCLHDMVDSYVINVGKHTIVPWILEGLIECCATRSSSLLTTVKWMVKSFYKPICSMGLEYLPYNWLKCIVKCRSIFQSHGSFGKGLKEVRGDQSHGLLGKAASRPKEGGPPAEPSACNCPRAEP